MYMLISASADFFLVIFLIYFFYVNKDYLKFVKFISTFVGIT